MDNMRMLGFVKNLIKQRNDLITDLGSKTTAVNFVLSLLIAH
jgi:hypothetical protein